jgi:flagellar biosynthesis chaperone FliJ
MQVNANTQVSVDVLKKAIDANKNQVNNLLNMQQNAQNKLQTQTQKNDTVPKSNTIGSLFDKKV